MTIGLHLPPRGSDRCRPRSTLRPRPAARSLSTRIGAAKAKRAQPTRWNLKTVFIRDRSVSEKKSFT